MEYSQTIPAGGPITVEGPGPLSEQHAELPDGRKTVSYFWEGGLYVVVILPLPGAPDDAKVQVLSNGHLVFDTKTRLLRVYRESPLN